MFAEPSPSHGGRAGGLGVIADDLQDYACTESASAYINEGTVPKTSDLYAHRFSDAPSKFCHVDIQFESVHRQVEPFAGDGGMTGGIARSRAAAQWVWRVRKKYECVVRISNNLAQPGLPSRHLAG